MSRLTNYQSYRLSFPSEVTSEAVAEVMRTLAAEGRGRLLDPASPTIFETLLRRQQVSWWISGDASRLRHLQAASERVLAGLAWQRARRPSLAIERAVELRVDSPDRLLDERQVEAAVARLLDVAKELTKGEVVLVQWQIGVWLPRSPIPPVSESQPHTIWNLPDWGRPERDSEQVTAARKKQAEHLFAAVGRVAVAGIDGNAQRCNRLLTSVVNAYQLLRSPGVGVSRRRLPSWWVRSRLDVAQVPRLGPAVRLSAAELAGVIGWPVGTPTLPGVDYIQATRLRIDHRLLVQRPRTGDRVIGEAGYPGQAGTSVVLRTEDGLRHLHVIGPSGAGKSTMLANLILSDITGGRGVVAIDPKGDLVTEVLARLPERWAERVVVLDPTDPSPVGFNPLSGGGSSTVGIDGVLHVLQSIWAGSWGPRLGDVLHAGLLTLARSPGHCLPELPLLLGDAGYRRPLVARAVAADPLGLGSFWPWFDKLSDDNRAQVLAPVMNKLRAFLYQPELRAVLAQAEPRFNLASVFSGGADRRCLLVRLSQGQIGSQGAQLLGSLLMAQLWRLALGRSAVPAKRRWPISWYLDEFQEFLRLPLDLADALVQARGLGIGLVLAHQHLDQLDKSVRSAVLANAGSRVAFRLDQDDAAVIAKRTRGVVRPEDLSGLAAYEAYASLLANGQSTPYGSLKTRPLDQAWPELRLPESLLSISRQHYGVPARETEAALRRLIEGRSGEASSGGPRGPLGGRRTGGGSS